jgi:hypothetical protein
MIIITFYRDCIKWSFFANKKLFHILFARYLFHLFLPFMAQKKFNFSDGVKKKQLESSSAGTPGGKA